MDRTKFKKMSDSELVKRLKMKMRNDIFEELYNRYKNMIYSYIRKFLYRIPDDIAKDLMQEIFIKVYLKLSSLENPDAFRAWLYKIARSFCLKYIRSNKSFNISIENYKDSSLGFHLKDARINIENDYINNEVKNVVFREINILDNKTKELILLKFFNNLTYNELSEITGIPVRTIKYKVKKSLGKICKKLKKEGYI